MKQIYLSLVPGLILVLALSNSLWAGPNAQIDKPAPDFTLVDNNGQEHSLSKLKGKYVVLEWVNFDCPFVQKHYGSKNMQSLQKTYRDKDVIWFSICSSGQGNPGYFEGEALKQHMEKNEATPTAYLVDADGKVGKMYGAKTTPHMFIINPKGVLIYAGGIDDKASTDKADIEGANNYVKTVLNAALAGKEVSVKTSVPYGCSVKYKK